MTKVGRNDPCPCGSGKKYKKCCEMKESAPRKLAAHKIEAGGLAAKTPSISELFKKTTFPKPSKPEESALLQPEDSQKKEDSEPPAEDPTEKS